MRHQVIVIIVNINLQPRPFECITITFCAKYIHTYIYYLYLDKCKFTFLYLLDSIYNVFKYLVLIHTHGSRSWPFTKLEHYTPKTKYIHTNTNRHINNEIYNAQFHKYTNPSIHTMLCFVLLLVQRSKPKLVSCERCIFIQPQSTDDLVY